MSWPSARTTLSAASLSVRPVGWGKPSVVELHLLDDQAVGLDPFDGREPVEDHAFLLGVRDLLGVGGHPLPGAAVDDHGVGGAQASGGPGGVDGRVAAAVHRDPAAEQRPLAVLQPVEQGHGVQDPRGRGRGQVRAVPQLRTDGEEGCVPALVGHHGVQVGDRGVDLQGDAEVEQPGDLGVEHLTRQPVARDAVAHHPAGDRCGLPDGDRVTAPGQVVGRGESGRPGADDQHPPPGGRGSDRDAPALGQRLVAEEALDGVDADRLVEVAAVAGGLARVVADPAADGREGVGLHDAPPGRLVARAAALRVVQPVRTSSPAGHALPQGAVRST